MNIERVNSVIIIPMKNEYDSWVGIFCKCNKYSLLTTTKGERYVAASRINPLSNRDAKLVWLRSKKNT